MAGSNLTEDLTCNNLRREGYGCFKELSMAAPASPLKVRMMQWVASYLLGAIPLFVHLIMFFSVNSPAGWKHNWTGDVAFMNISVGTVATLSIITSYFKSQGALNLPPRIFVLIVIILIFLLLSAVVYALSAAGISSAGISVLLIIVMLAGISVPSLFLEYDIALNDLS